MRSAARRRLYVWWILTLAGLAGFMFLAQQGLL